MSLVESPPVDAHQGWQVPAWAAVRGLRHGFLGRAGGASRGPFASRNLSDRVGDDPEAVRENRRRLEALLAPLRLVLPVQVHGARIAGVTADADPGAADGLVTEVAGLALGVLTADCVPVLLVAPAARAVGAVHAGWRGTAAGVVAGAVERMQRDFGATPSAIDAALGPAIGPCCYEVDEEVVAAVESQSGPLPAGACVWKNGRPSLDLRAVNALQLERCGVPRARIVAVGPCTRCAMAECFSHRGAGGATGRQLSFVGWQE